VTPLRALRTARYAVRDVCLIIGHVALAIASVGIAKAVWMIIDAVTTKNPK
jgi:hypothetical protein